MQKPPIFMSEVNFGMNRFNCKEQSIRLTQKVSWVKMHVIVAMTLMLLFIQELEPTFVVRKQA